jgi:type II secretory pathway pseudopilin PulG
LSFSRCTQPRIRRAFSALELFVVIGILVVLVSIFVPYILRNREINYRTRCSDNLRQLYAALGQYAHLNNGDYPRVTYDAVNNPNGYTCYTGADDVNPFAKNSTIKPNDVTASLWLLIRLKLARSSNFICPSTNDAVDELVTEPAGRGNFRSPQNLSYSYASPFSSAAGYKLNDTRPAGFALMADKNPGTPSDGVIPPVDAAPLKMSVANSNNHAKAGENVLYADSHVEFKSDPYCGIGDTNHPELHDNIYTALAAKPLEKGQNIPGYANGILSRDVGPAWDFDSYLVPTSTDPLEPAVVVVVTQPTSKPVTQPASIPIPTEPTTVRSSTQPTSLPATTQIVPSTFPTTGPATRP